MERARGSRKQRQFRVRELLPSERGQLLSRSFYARDARVVAREVLGSVVVVRSPRSVTAGRIVETEAYCGPEDRAAHSFGGRRTARTEVMFGPPGCAYVFMIYGMHFHFNLVTSRVGVPHAVLVRAIEPLAGVDVMAERRGLAADRRELTNGPGKLCRALGIGRAHYGADLCDGVGGVTLIEGAPPSRIGRSPRIGVDYAGAWAKRPFRYFDAESRYVSTWRGSRGAA
jgi:DNA-3-methyladenine glycosylase